MSPSDQFCFVYFLVRFAASPRVASLMLFWMCRALFLFLVRLWLQRLLGA